MPLESATYINGLIASNPASTDTVSQADDHIRLIKQVLKATFPNFTGAMTATDTDLSNVPDYVENFTEQLEDITSKIVPTGAILMWSGSIATIPSGWALCNGANGTPDLRNRFIVGAGSSYGVGATGGADTVTLTVNQIPSHNHQMNHTGTGSGNGIQQGGGSLPTTASNIITGAAGGGQPHENRPPYYALAYIMKL